MTDEWLPMIEQVSFPAISMAGWHGRPRSPNDPKFAVAHDLVVCSVRSEPLGNAPLPHTDDWWLSLMPNDVDAMRVAGEWKLQTSQIAPVPVFAAFSSAQIHIEFLG